MKIEIVIFSPGNNNIVMSLTLYVIIRPLKYVFENIMENGASQRSKCSIFHNIYKSIQNLNFSLIFFNVV